ncbi:UNVERIFIED_CONTAM: hypothetical protein K2H54_065754 [Gekko kuhli]
MRRPAGSSAKGARGPPGFCRHGLGCPLPSAAPPLNRGVTAGGCMERARATLPRQLTGRGARADSSLGLGRPRWAEVNLTSSPKDEAFTYNDHRLYEAWSSDGRKAVSWGHDPFLGMHVSTQETASPWLPPSGTDWATGKEVHCTATVIFYAFSDPTLYLP